jgi:AbrB family looped-hinge helix DNA binding protein
MAKVTSKLQVTIPKAVADRLGIAPGDELEWRVEGAAARVARSTIPALSPAAAEALFDDMMRRHDALTRRRPAPARAPRDRGWTREELYRRGRAR